MSSGVKPVLLWVVPVNKSALRGGIVRKECHRFLENKWMSGKIEEKKDEKRKRERVI